MSSDPAEALVELVMAPVVKAGRFLASEIDALRIEIANLRKELIALEAQLIKKGVV